VREIAQLAGPIGVAVVFVGALQRAQERACAYLTLASDHAADAAKILGVRTVVPVHYEGWAQLHAGADQLRSTFAGNGVSDGACQTRSEDRTMKPNHEQLLACSRRTAGRSNENV
jgi:L-ascorbate metabolism protein UlaG (beta-lactamase superfamily)